MLTTSLISGSPTISISSSTSSSSSSSSCSTSPLSYLGGQPGGLTASERHKKKSFSIDTLLADSTQPDERKLQISPIKVPALPAVGPPGLGALPGPPLSLEQHLLRLHTLQMIANAHRLSSCPPPLPPPSTAANHFLDQSLETLAWRSPTSSSTESETDRSLDVEVEPVGPTGPTKPVTVRFSPDLRSI